jgi:hypothetical protein
VRASWRRDDSAITRVPFDSPLIRRDFPILKQRVHDQPLVYLDNAIIFRLTWAPTMRNEAAVTLEPYRALLSRYVDGDLPEERSSVSRNSENVRF